MEGGDVGVRGEREWLVRCNWSGKGDAEIIQGRGGGRARVHSWVINFVGGEEEEFVQSLSNGGGGSTRETAVHTELD